jgi:hypothetical protein
MVKLGDEKVQRAFSNTVDAIRTSLPGQSVAQRRIRIESEFGLIMPWDEIHARIIATLPRRAFRTRKVNTWGIKQYERPIPDEALLRYAAARESALFRDFSVAEVGYEEVTKAEVDPWLLAWVTVREAVVLAFWD